MTQSDITIPPGFIDRFVWSPFNDIVADGAAEPINNPYSDHPAVPQSYAFPDNVVPEVLADAGEKEEKDPIVEGVKNGKDLSEHEKKLLQCIVDCGE
jgi:hypothetical protein